MVIISLSLILGVVLGFEICRVGALIILRSVIESRFLSTTGRIEKFELVTSIGKVVQTGEHTVLPISEFHVRVEYDVNGKRYMTDKVSPWSFVSSSDYVISIRQKLERSIKDDAGISVIYNPENPGVAVLTSEIGRRPWMEFGMTVILVSSMVPIYAWFKAAGEVVPAIDVAEYIVLGCAMGVAAGAILFARILKKMQA